MTYYNDVYAYNHGNYLLQPFDSKVPEEYFVMDEGTDIENLILQKLAQ